MLSDNVDSLVGMRLVGIEGIVVHEKEDLLDEIEKAMTEKEIAILLITTKLVNMAYEVISELKLRQSKTLIIEIPDRHGDSKIGQTIDNYVSEAIGVKLGGD